MGISGKQEEGQTKGGMEKNKQRGCRTNRRLTWTRAKKKAENRKNFAEPHVPLAPKGPERKQRFGPSCDFIV